MMMLVMVIVIAVVVVAALVAASLVVAAVVVIAWLKSCHFLHQRRRPTFCRTDYLPATVPGRPVAFSFAIPTPSPPPPLPPCTHRQACRGCTRTTPQNRLAAAALVAAVAVVVVVAAVAPRLHQFWRQPLRQHLGKPVRLR